MKRATTATHRTGDRVLLIVENDLAFSRFCSTPLREKGSRGWSRRSAASALALAREYKPTAITLDIFLSDIEGWRVLERLKNDISARHIPICVISTDEARERALSCGALRFVAKPIQSKNVLDELLDYLNSYTRTPARNVLVVEHDKARLQGIMDFIDGAKICALRAPRRRSRHAHDAGSDAPIASCSIPARPGSIRAAARGVSIAGTRGAGARVQ